MKVRIAACFFALVVGAVFPVGDASAGARAFSATRAFAAHPIARSAALHPFAGSLRHHAHNAFFARNRFHFRHRGFGLGLWGPGYDGYNGGVPDYPADRLAPYTEPLPLTSDPRYNPFGGGAPVHDSAVYVIPYRPGCDSETQKVPWRNGSERAITIVRC